MTSEEVGGDETGRKMRHDQSQDATHDQGLHEAAEQSRTMRHRAKGPHEAADQVARSDSQHIDRMTRSDESQEATHSTTSRMERRKSRRTRHENKRSGMALMTSSLTGRTKKRVGRPRCTGNVKPSAGQAGRTRRLAEHMDRVRLGTRGNGPGIRACRTRRRRPGHRDWRRRLWNQPLSIQQAFTEGR